MRDFQKVWRELSSCTTSSSCNMIIKNISSETMSKTIVYCCHSVPRMWEWQQWLSSNGSGHSGIENSGFPTVRDASRVRFPLSRSVCVFHKFCDLILCDTRIKFIIPRVFFKRIFISTVPLLLNNWTDLNAFSCAFRWRSRWFTSPSKRYFAI